MRVANQFIERAKRYPSEKHSGLIKNDDYAILYPNEIMIA